MGLKEDNDATKLKPPSPSPSGTTTPSRATTRTREQGCTNTERVFADELLHDAKLLPFFYKNRTAIRLAHEVFDQMLVPRRRAPRHSGDLCLPRQVADRVIEEDAVASAGGRRPRAEPQAVAVDLTLDLFDGILVRQQQVPRNSWSRGVKSQDQE